MPCMVGKKIQILVKFDKVYCIAEYVIKINY